MSQQPLQPSAGVAVAAAAAAASAAAAKQTDTDAYVKALLGDQYELDDGVTRARIGRRTNLTELEGDAQFRVGDSSSGQMVVFRKGTHQSPVGLYKGEFVNGAKEGRGSFNYSNGDVYIGGSRRVHCAGSNRCDALQMNAVLLCICGYGW